ncbi:MAG: Flp family type IVb pilin [Planctomycetes bacterium]|nr:Flp family type IVb pilin [Planctomycetota bacterium]
MAFFRALFTTDDEGNTVTEYAVCLALIVLASIVAVTALGVSMSSVFTNVADIFS